MIDLENMAICTLQIHKAVRWIPISIDKPLMLVQVSTDLEMRMLPRVDVVINFDKLVPVLSPYPIHKLDTI